MTDSKILEELLYACARGDRKAFSSLYEATSAQMMGVSLSILEDRGLAEEALQEAFAQIWYSAKDYRPDLSKPTTWLATIVRNRALDVYRKERRSPSHANQGEEARTLPDVRNAAGGSTELQDLVDCMDALPKEQCESILMAYYFGHTHAEISQRLRQPLGTIKSWVRRGVNRIRECLEQ